MDPSEFAAISAAGYTVVSTPELPRPDIEQAVGSDLRFLLELDDPSLSRLAATSWWERKRRVRDAARRIQSAVRAWDGSEALLGVVFHRAPDELAIALHDEDAGLLAAWRDRWPIEGGCPPEFDFLIVDFELARSGELPPALMACHCNVGDRPLVLGDVPLVEKDGQADTAWLVDTALRCGVAGTVAQAWSSGETIKPDLEEAHISRQTVRELDVDWPLLSVVVCAYNAETTLEECLSHCDQLEYPKLELIVVDDGSTDATPAIAREHSRAQLLTIPHSGLTVARNVGYQSARGDLIAYLDPDAYPSPEWPWYLALAALGERAGGSGGPNVPPPGELASARAVAAIPGGPVPQLLSPERAEHLPGCNMAFWRRVLEQLRGFDDTIEAGDDVEFEWRVVDSTYELAYHPAALVWHHRRPGLGPFLRQQRHYGRGQALLERRHPERYPAGYRIRSRVRRLRLRGDDGSRPHPCHVSYRTLPRNEGVLLELAHQWGMPVAVALALTAPLGLVRRRLVAPAAGASAFAAGLFAIDVGLAGKGRRRSDKSIPFRGRVASFRLLRPLAFRWGHLRGRWELRRRDANWPPPPDQQDREIE